MTDRLTTALIRKAAKLAQDHSMMTLRIGALFEARYGATFSEANCNELINFLDYGLGGSNLTLAECDRLMAEEGYTVLEQKS